MPEGGAYLWSIYLDLQRSRPVGEGGPSGIPYTEIEAWARLRARTLAPWEVEILREIDGKFLEVMAEARRERAHGSR